MIATSGGADGFRSGTYDLVRVLREVNVMPCRPIVVVSYDYPQTPDGSKDFLAQADRLIKEVLGIPGVLEYRAYYNADGASPLATSVLVCDTVENICASRHVFPRFLFEMRAHGATNIGVQILAPSPQYPDPIRR